MAEGGRSQESGGKEGRREGAGRVSGKIAVQIGFKGQSLNVEGSMLNVER
jgi:hypothetical protein